MDLIPNLIKQKLYFLVAASLILNMMQCPYVYSQIGKRFPSEKKMINDPVTGTSLIFLTSTPAGDSKIYKTHQQLTSDGQWLIFRSVRARNEAMAVNEKTGDIVQVTEGCYMGMLCVARKSMKLYYLRNVPSATTYMDCDGRRNRFKAAVSRSKL